VREDLRSLAAAHGRPRRQHAVEDAAQDDRHDEACGERLDADRDVPDIRPGEPDPAAVARRLECDLGPRVAGADDQDVAVPELLRVAIGGGMQLDHGGVQLGAVVGHARALPASDRDHDVVGPQAVRARLHDEAWAVACHAMHLHAQPHRQVEPGRVRLEVVRHRVLRRI
jgi:hypothetical protein